jgi:hypothetical protein
MTEIGLRSFLAAEQSSLPLPISLPSAKSKNRDQLPTSPVSSTTRNALLKGFSLGPSFTGIKNRPEHSFK